MSSRRLLTDVESEEALAKSIWPWIDTVSFTEAMTTVLSLLLASAVVVIAGCHGQSPVSIQESKRTFKNSSSHVFRFSASPLSRINHFVAFRLGFIRKNPAEISFRYRVDTSNRFSATVVVNRSVVGCEKANISLFSDHFIAYDSADLTLWFEAPPREYRGFILTTVIGESHYTAFQWYFRLLFSVVELWHARLFASQWQIRRFRGWPLERRLAFLLLVTAMIANDPLCIVVRNWGSVIALLKGIVNESDSIAKQTAIGLTVTVTSGVRRLHELFQTGEIVGGDSVARVLSGAEGTVAIAVSVWAIVLIGRCACADATDRVKAAIYSVVCSAVAALQFLVIGPARLIGAFANGSFPEIAEFSVLNAFAIMIPTLEWPVLRAGRSPSAGQFRPETGPCLEQANGFVVE
jgi:hypothetical protein